MLSSQKIIWEPYELIELSSKITRQSRCLWLLLRIYYLVCMLRKLQSTEAEGNLICAKEANTCQQAVRTFDVTTFEVDSQVSWKLVG